MKPLMQLIDVCKFYKTKEGLVIQALKNVSLSINEGEVLGLLGVNGAGKTTLSSILASLHPLTSGEVLLEGVGMYDDLIEYRKKIGFCPQRPNVSPYLSVTENLQFAGEFYGLDRNSIDTRIEQLLHDFELTRYAQHTLQSLSGGYKQRLMLARTLMHKPRLVILDEPTVALDAAVRKYLWGVIRALKQSGVTVILTTHYLEEAEQLADRVCVLHRGEIVLVDSPQNLKTRFKAQDLESVFLTLLDQSLATELQLREGAHS